MCKKKSFFKLCLESHVISNFEEKLSIKKFKAYSMASKKWTNLKTDRIQSCYKCLF